MATYIVKPGDNLTVIARRFGLASWRELYNHPRNADFKRKRPNPNLIHPGDKLYVPGDDGSVSPGVSSKPEVIDLETTTIYGESGAPDHDDEKILQEVVDDLPPDVKAAAQKVLGGGGMLLTAGQLASLTPWFGLGAAAMAGPLIMAGRFVLGWASAWETNERMYGHRACAYTTTAWAFGEPRPSGSPEMMRRFRSFSSDNVVRARVNAWSKSSSRTWDGLERAYREHGVDKKAWQALYQIEAHRHNFHNPDPRKKLCHAMLTQFESEYKRVNLDSWKGGYSVLYPR